MAEGDTGDDPKRPRGRPRDLERSQAILDAAYKLLMSEGLERVTTVAIARTAGVSTATLYRWWPSKEAIVLDAYLQGVGKMRPFDDTSDSLDTIRNDLRDACESLIGREGKALASIIAAAQHSADAREAYVERFGRPRRRQILSVLERVVAKGELRSDVDLEVLIDSIYAPIYTRLLIGHAELSTRMILHHFDVLMDGARTSGV